MKKPPKRYDATFKRDAVELLLTSGKPLKALAIELGVCDVTLRNWRDRHLQKTEPIEADGKKLSIQYPFPRRYIFRKRNASCSSMLQHGTVGLLGFR